MSTQPPAPDEVALLRARVALLTSRLAEAEGGVARRAARGARGLIDRCAAVGTGRRRVLDALVLAARRAAGRLPGGGHRAGGAGAQRDACSFEHLRRFLELKLDLFLSAPRARIALPRHDEPLVSILLVTYNRAAYNLQCLESIRANSDVPYEVVIVDNGSTDATGELLARVDGATVIRNAGNDGFLHATNRGAAAARGRWLLLLNNDTQPLPGYLSRLVAAGETPGCGAAGARLVLPDGSLQEAGSIVWRDGTCSGYGRGGDPGAPEFLFAREVDYCSGACLLVRRDLFERAGGFDARYAPAYYEEVDLCLALRELGHAVRYEPETVVVHYEFGSAGGAADAIAQQRRNRAIFAAKWEARLRGHVEAGGAASLLAARDARRDARRILIVDDRVPDPALGTGYPRSHAIVSTCVDLGWLVTFFPFLDGGRPEPVTAGLAARGVEVMHGLDRRDFARFLAARRDFYDVAWISRPHTMREAIGTIRDLAPAAKVVYDAEALFSARLALQARLEGRPFTAEQEREAAADEARLAARADAIAAVSARELDLFRAHARPGLPAAVVCHPCAPSPTPAPFAERADLLFVGAVLNADSPNVDTIRHLAREVLPRVRREEPVRLVVAGTVLLEEVLALAAPEVVVTGRVDDMRHWYDRCRVFVAPTRYAAGIPLKLLEAFAAGIPAVISPLLAEQLGVDESVALIAGDPEEFARKALRLYRDEGLWKRLRQAALEHVGRTCSPAGFREAVSGLLAQLVRGR